MTRPVAFIGIDPGMGGAIACLVHPAVELLVEDMPALLINEKRRLNHWNLATLLQRYALDFDVQMVLVENVGAMPGQSPNGMFWFGFSCGAVQQAVVSTGLPLNLVTPQTWKKAYGLRGGKENKDQSRQKASQLFPSHAGLWARKKDDGRAEAVLLAHYGSKLQ